MEWVGVQGALGHTGVPKGIAGVSGPPVGALDWFRGPRNVPKGAGLDWSLRESPKGV